MLFLIPIVGFWLGHEHFMGASDMTPLYGALLLLLIYLALFLINSFVLLPRLFFRHHVSWYVFLVLVLSALSMALGQFVENEYRNIYGQSLDVDMLFHYPNFNIKFFILAIMVISFNVAVSLVFKALGNEMKDKILAKETLASELEYLKYQINPHFLMNTLNNIHALVDIDSEDAKNKLLKLSKLLRFVLYMGPKTTVQLEEEIVFLENYIDLMRIRYIDKVEINFSYPSVIPNLNIPTLLLVPFVENAFKHGISYEKKSFIDVCIEYKGDRILVNIRNSKAVNHMKDDKKCGIGVENTRRRLQLLYGDDYKLVIKDDDDIYNVELNIKAL